MNSALKNLLQTIKVLPVLTINSEREAVDVCTSLAAGGIRAVEITLRTPAAWAAISAVQQALPSFTVAAGTIKTSADLERLAKLNIAFAVSPGFTPQLSTAATANAVEFLPDIATPSELLLALSTGRDCFKLFPAEAVGGIPLLKSLAAPFAEAYFCPTGGINPTNLPLYLKLPNVVCVGGSWMVAPELINAGRWDEITRLSRECMAGLS